MTLFVTAFYISLLAFIFLWLTRRTISARRTAKIAVGDGGNEQLLRMMRTHANFVEYVPLAMLLFALAELHGTPHILLHAIGITLIVGRILHAYGVAQLKENFRLRVTGMAITLTIISLLALTNLIMIVLQII